MYCPLTLTFDQYFAVISVTFRLFFNRTRRKIILRIDKTKLNVVDFLWIEGRGGKGTLDQKNIENLRLFGR